MPEFCTCGAQLPPDARFCHKCGKPQFDYPAMEAETAPPPLAIEPPAAPPPEIGFHNRVAVRTGVLVALTTMLFSTLLFAVPALTLVVEFLSGVLAVYVYMRRTGQRVTPRSGARMGWITGVFLFAFTTAAVTLLVVALSASPEFRNELANLPPGMQKEFVSKILNDPAYLLTNVAGSFIALTTLAMLGGALGAKLLDRR